MKFKHILCALQLFLSLGASSVYAQQNSDSGITGHVTDTKTGDHLPYVTVLLKGTPDISMDHHYHGH